MSNRATKKCIMCGEPARWYHGHVIAREKMALGNFIEVKILAGFCEECNKITLNVDLSDKKGCYGKYNNDWGIKYLKGAGD